MLSESDAILIYLADKVGRLMPSSGKERTLALELLFLQASLQGPMFGQRMHFSIFSSETPSSLPTAALMSCQNSQPLCHATRRLTSATSRG